MQWVKNGIDSEGIASSEEYGKYLKHNGFTTSQIRNVFGEIRRIQMTGFKKKQTDFLLLKPKMAYAAQRSGKDGALLFKEILNCSWDAIVSCDTLEEKEIAFDNLCDFMEAILAYHKAYGGKD